VVLPLPLLLRRPVVRVALLLRRLALHLLLRRLRLRRSSNRDELLIRA